MTCPNRGNEHTGELCNACGQKNGDLHVPIGSLISEVAEETLGLDSRVRHTLAPFFLKPGEVTRDYLSGRRVRYTSPLKMYLVAAAIFFFAFTLHPHQRFVQIDQKDEADLKSDPKKDSRFEHLMKDQARKLNNMDPEEGSKQLAANMASMLPKALVILLPIFALHYHAFALVLLAPISLPGAPPGLWRRPVADLGEAHRTE
jgi:hypothetical protein